MILSKSTHTKYILTLLSINFRILILVIDKYVHWHKKRRDSSIKGDICKLLVINRSQKIKYTDYEYFLTISIHFIQYVNRL